MKFDRCFLAGTRIWKFIFEQEKTKSFFYGTRLELFGKSEIKLFNRTKIFKSDTVVYMTGLIKTARTHIVNEQANVIKTKLS